MLTEEFTTLLGPYKMAKSEHDYAMLTLIPTGEPTSGPHCFRAKYLGIFDVKNRQKIA
jgi:hypothetical protein